MQERNVAVRLEGKNAIVTGSGNGIGRAIALRFATEGANVTVAEIEEDSGRDTVELIQKAGGTAVYSRTDTSDGASVKQTVSNAIGAHGDVDILINNAAFRRGEDRVPILDLSEELFQKVMDIKVTGTFLCTKAVVKHMIDQGDGGKIVNISSTAGKTGAPNFLAYNGANFAIVGMTQSMARELGPHKINVNCVCPGAVDTSRMDVVRDNWEQMAANTPIGRNGTDEEVGDFCAYLCTEASSWIHGQSINQNGGAFMAH